ncbi:MAG: GNAT family N-acetyltransferase [Deltaproteobacteria bacterium]|nr:GNAT family N-acetyltransferase [Deltaproteobacteria bacterium]
MDNLIIREMKEEDAGIVDRIYKSIVKTPTPINFQRICEEASQGRGAVSFVAEYDGNVVGYMISYILSGGFGIDKGAWIAMLGVDPKYMGQGIGKSLATEIFRFCKEKGIQNIFTSVRWDSVDLLSFFKAMDFDRSHFINLRKVLE